MESGAGEQGRVRRRLVLAGAAAALVLGAGAVAAFAIVTLTRDDASPRSEERRVGKECRL